MAHTARRAAREIKRATPVYVMGADVRFSANDEPEPRCEACRVCGGDRLAIEDNGLCRSCRGLARIFANATTLES